MGDRPTRRVVTVKGGTPVTISQRYTNGRTPFPSELPSLPSESYSSVFYYCIYLYADCFPSPSLRSPSPILRRWQMLPDVSAQRHCLRAFGRSFKAPAGALHIRNSAHIGY